MKELQIELAKQIAKNNKLIKQIQENNVENFYKMFEGIDAYFEMDFEENGMEIKALENVETFKFKNAIQLTFELNDCEIRLKVLVAYRDLVVGGEDLLIINEGVGIFKNINFENVTKKFGKKLINFLKSV